MIGERLMASLRRRQRCSRATGKAICIFAGFSGSSGVGASSAYVEAGLERIAASENDRYGGCAALLDVSLARAGLDCAQDWVAFDCGGVSSEHDDGLRMYRLLSAALAAEKSVGLLVTDEQKRDGYCRGSRITVQDSPFVDVDSDNDGVDDLDDEVPLVAFETRDADDDGIGDIADEDDDNDGVPDIDDALPNDPDEWQDTDRDGIGNIADGDDDGDGLPDAEDPFPLGNVAFDLHHGSDYPIGIVAAAGKLFVLDGRDERVYAYTLDGVREPGSDFDLEPERRSLVDIAYASDHFYVLYERLPTIQAYSRTGQRAYGRDIALDPSNRTVSAMDYYEGLFRVVQVNVDRSRVYAYTEAGERAPVHDFDLDAESMQPSGISHRPGGVFVSDHNRSKAYAYTETGQRLRSRDFEIEGGSSTGMTYVAGRFYIPYLHQPVVIAYTGDGRRASRYDFDISPGANDTPYGIAYSDGRFYVVDQLESKVFVYSTTGEHLPGHDFKVRGPEARMATLAAGTFLVGAGPGRIDAYDLTGARVPSKDLRLGSASRAAGVEYALGRIYVGDGALRRLLAYTTEGVRTPRYDISVLAGPSGPRGIAYGRGRFYVGDWSRVTQMYVYDGLGRYLPDHNFDLGEAFHTRERVTGPEGMTYADGAIYVIDLWGDRILPYPID